MKSAKLYFSQCSINGFNYIFDPSKKQTPLSHRIGWTLAVIISCGLCIWLAILINDTVLNTHTITSQLHEDMQIRFNDIINLNIPDWVIDPFSMNAIDINMELQESLIDLPSNMNAQVASSTYQVGRIPFPVISICNNNKVSRRDFQVIKKLLLENKVEEQEIETFGRSLASLITFSTYDYYPKKRRDHTDIFDILENNNYTVDVLMRTVQQDCSKFLKFCMLQSVPVNCSEYFTMIRTSEGFCCGFNYRGPEHFGDKFGGMTVVLHFETDDYMSPVRPYYGGNVLINDATDYPESSAKYTVLQPWEPMEIRMKPWLIESTKNVQYLSEEIRNCLYNEGAGTTQAFYSYNSCLSKCRSLLMYKHCGCIPFFYLPIGKDDRRKCNLADNKCLHRNKMAFFSLATNFSEGLNCNCKPECTDRFYDLNRKRGKVSHSTFHSFFERANTTDFTTLSVYYLRMTCSQFNLDVFMQWNDAFGYYGGLMSLGIGEMEGKHSPIK
ncbi:pickpocket protein 11-like [Arctopsyche grandis]|uniref:pickpocket protein 11-like n=1 Tax=Arctopsyche grandis TaxID=121162 RepID=UPI00406D778B